MRIPIKAGEDHPRAKFSQDEANEIRQRFEEAPEMTLRTVAREYAVAPETVRRIKNNQSYRE